MRFIDPFDYFSFAMFGSIAGTCLFGFVFVAANILHSIWHMQW